MKPTDTSEKGLEYIIAVALVKKAGYVQGDPRDYDRGNTQSIRPSWPSSTQASAC